MTTITDYMVKHTTRVLTLSDISKDVGISESSLKKIVHKSYGKPPMAYFEELKIEEAKRLIATSPLKLTEISEYLGFHLYTIFLECSTKKSELPQPNTQKHPGNNQDAFCVYY